MNRRKLILQIKNGNQEALETIITEMYPQVYAFLYRKMKQNDRAKDITQEVFLKFVENIDQYNEEDKLLNYLFRIGINLASNYYKSLNYLDDRELDESRISMEEDPHAIVMKKANHDIMMRYISQLSEISREIIILRYYHEMKFKDIADILKIPESTAKSRHHRGIKFTNLGSFLILFYFDTDETITLLSFQIVFEFYF